MRVFFLSDLHLEDGDADASERLSLFLRQLPQQNDILILGGDIFDLFVGNKQVFRRRHAKSIESIREVSSRGVIFHYLEGNHDFHFSGVFADCSNICVHRGDFELSANGRRIWVSHGDLIDPEDTGYRLLRAVTKNAAFKLFVDAVPDIVVDLIGSRSSGVSRKYNSGRIDDENTNRLRRLYLEYAHAKVREGFDHVLVGHSHLRDQVPIQEGGRSGEYLNLGYSSRSLLYAVLEAGAHSFQAKEFSSSHLSS